MEQKYRALLNVAQQQQLPHVDNIRLCFQMLSLTAAIDRDCAVQLAPHGLSEGRFILLFLLDNAPDGLAPAALAEQAGVTRATVTGLLDGLERDALIARHADPVDRRALCIRLTDTGKALAAQVFEQHSRWIASLYASLTATEREQLSTLLSKVAQHLPTQGTPTP